MRRTKAFSLSYELPPALAGGWLKKIGLKPNLKNGKFLMALAQDVRLTPFLCSKPPAEAGGNS
jgi:hypothetical protein